jgi:hypothetical protein
MAATRTIWAGDDLENIFPQAGSAGSCPRDGTRTGGPHGLRLGRQQRGERVEFRHRGVELRRRFIELEFVFQLFELIIEFIELQLFVQLLVEFFIELFVQLKLFFKFVEQRRRDGTRRDGVGQRAARCRGSCAATARHERLGT